MPAAITQAQPPLEFIPPDLNLTLVRTLQVLLPVLMKSRTAISQVDATHVERLVNLYQQFQAGKIRFLMAFRHPSADDPYCLAYLLSRLVPQAARQQSVVLRSPIHAHFIYDRGIPLWAGSFTGWLYSQLGGTPIHRGKVDRQGLKSARNLFVNGALPMAAAPEGATNGHSEIISPLEPGVAQLGFWCVEDLLKAGRSEEVFIVPIGLQYRYVEPPWQQLEQLLQGMEADSGLLKQSPAHQEQPFNLASGDRTLPDPTLYKRLYQLGEHLLSVMEGFYSRFYHRSLPSLARGASQSEAPPEGAELSLSNEAFRDRLQVLLDTALQVAEQYFNLQPKGSLIDRCRRLEQAGWDYVYRDDLKQLEAISALDRGLADRIAEEANLRVWHMRLVESFVAVTGRYVLERPTAERFAETALLMWDVIARIKGGDPFQRPKLGEQQAQMTVGIPLSVSERWEEYQSSRRGAKQAVETLTQDLQTALESTIT